MHSIPVRLGPRSYDIIIESGILARAGEHIGALPVSRRIVVISDTNVAPLYLQALARSLEACGFTMSDIILPAGEQQKDIRQATALYNRLSQLGCDRTTAVIALGGGVVGDIAGFIAATFLRGVPFIQIPTTLLAQVDSSVGGKTGINLPAGKNLVGAFYQPCIVLIDPGVLTTLAPREFASGMAEVIKYAIIRDAAFFEYLSRAMNSALRLDPAVLHDSIARCCAIKAAVTVQDETEHDVRAILNFGHTVGHALETLTGYRAYTHGEAVAIGMHAAACMSSAWGFCSPAVVSRIAALLSAAGLPTALPPVAPDALYDIMLRDKKRAGETLRMVVIDEIGAVRIEEIPFPQLLTALEALPGGRLPSPA